MESQKEQSPGGVNRFQAAVRPLRVNPGPFPQRGPWRKLWVSSNGEPAKASVSFPHASSEFKVTFLFSAPGSSNFEGNMAKRGVSGEQACVCCPLCLMLAFPSLVCMERSAAASCWQEKMFLLPLPLCEVKWTLYSFVLPTPKLWTRVTCRAIKTAAASHPGGQQAI